MRIPGADLRAQHAALQNELGEAASRVLSSGAYILGSEVERFEREFADFCEVEHALGVANGTDALLLALKALHVGGNDAIAVPAFTFAATAEAVCLAGARPVFVDIDPHSFNLDPQALRRVLEANAGKIRAIIAVHLYGQPAAMAEIDELAAAHGAVVIEDAAQAHGARYRGKRTGGLGRMGCFSFYPTKNLGAAGDAGAVTTNDAGLAARLAMLRDHGQREKYVHTVVGMNSRLDALQAALLSVKLPHLDGWNDRRRQIAGLYRRQLAGISALRLPTASDESEHVYHLYVIRCAERDALHAFLASRGVATAIHYPTILPQQRAFASTVQALDVFPVAGAAAREVLALPCYPELTDEAVAEVGNAIREWVSTR